MIKQYINKLLRYIGVKWQFFILPTSSTTPNTSISFAITVFNEAKSLHTLIESIIPYLNKNDEIVVQADKKNVTEQVLKVIERHRDKIKYTEFDLNFDFSKAKNHLNEQCQGEWIFQIDADELPAPWLLDNLRKIIHANPHCELFKIPRNNIFVNSDGDVIQTKVAWPDHQGRLFKNNPQKIKWIYKIHEVIFGHQTYTFMPHIEQYTLIHKKNMLQDKQKWQEWKRQFPKI